MLQSFCNTVVAHGFYYVKTYEHNINCVFNFARNACNRVHCTRTGEHGSPLQNCSNGSYTTLGHKCFYAKQVKLRGLKF